MIHEADEVPEPTTRGARATPKTMLTLSDLAATAGTSRKAVLAASSELRPSTAKRGEDAPRLAAPVATATERRAQREVAYAGAVATAEAWEGAAGAERRSDALTFGSRRAAPTSAAELAAKFVAETPLERRIERILGDAGAGDARAVAAREALGSAGDGGDAAAAAAAAEERTAELRKTRSLLFYAERKAKYHARIKSKAYARTRKKRAAARDAAAEDAAAAADPALAAARDAARATKQVQERMDLRHSSTSAWARGAKIRGRGAVESRRAELAENLRLGRELKRKQAGDDDSAAESDGAAAAYDDDDDDDLVARARASLDDAAGDGPLATGGLLDMKFMRKARERAREDAREDAAALLRELEEAAGADDDDGDALADIAALGGAPAPAAVEAPPVPPVAMAAGAFTVASARRKRGAAAAAPPAPAAAPAPPADAANPWLAAATAARSRGRAPIARGGAIALAPAAEAPAAPAAEAPAPAPTAVESDGDRPMTALSQKELVALAFAADDGAEADFAALKKSELEPDVAPAAPALLGWGAWAGAGAPPPPKRRGKRSRDEPVAAPAPPVRDKAPHVILNPKRAKKAGLLKVAAVPYPFTSRSQYERYMARPVGEEWNAGAATRKLTRPKLVVRAGAAIEPIRKQKAP